MYAVFEESRAEEIIETGYEFGLSDDDILGRLQRKLDISIGDGAEIPERVRKTENIGVKFLSLILSSRQYSV